MVQYAVYSPLSRAVLGAELHTKFYAMPDDFVRYQLKLYNTVDSPAERNLTLHTIRSYEAPGGVAKYWNMAPDCDALPKGAPPLTGFDGVCKGKQEGDRVGEIFLHFRSPKNKIICCRHALAWMGQSL